MTKWTLALCPGPGANLARMDWGWSHCLDWVKVVVSGELTLLSGMCLPVLRQICLRYPVFSLQILPNLALCWSWTFSSCRYRMLYFLINFLGMRQLVQDLLTPYFIFSIFLIPRSTLYLGSFTEEQPAGPCQEKVNLLLSVNWSI